METPLSDRFPAKKFTIHAGNECQFVKYEKRVVGKIETLAHRLYQQPRFRIKMCDAKQTSLFGTNGYDVPSPIDEIRTHLAAEVTLIDANVTEYHQLGEDYRRVQHEPTRAAIEYAVRKLERELKTSVELIRLFEPDFKLHLSPVTEPY